MTPDMFAKLKRSLILHEGLRNLPYVDTLGNITIGIGYNLSARGLDDDWINSQYSHDVDYFYNQLNSDYIWFANLDTDRQIVLVDMCFMGYKKFQEFTEMLAALASADYVEAARQMLASEWATQVKGRALQLAQAMSSGIYNV